MSYPLDREASGYVAPCRFCGGMARGLRAGETIEGGKNCYEPSPGTAYEPWMCQHAMLAPTPRLARAEGTE